jgi:NAD+ synthase (glutamine-hydrolysing)
MNHTVTVALAQLDLVVGDVDGNTARILEFSARARDELLADLVVFPELSICGYPPEDLLFHSGLRLSVEKSLALIRESVRGIAVLVGFPEYEEDNTYNSCAVFSDGEVLCHYRKCSLPNYAVFDEERYFTAGKSAAVFMLNGIRIGLNVCEDIWQQAPIQASRTAGAECVIAINGSPYEVSSQRHRERVVATRIEEAGIPIIYLNMVGGQDELVFDGGSFATAADGDVRFRAPPFEEGLFPVVLQGAASGVEPARGEVAELLGDEESVYRALVTGTRDYVNKHGFRGVVLGLSGGIDSALVMAIACDAIGAEKVRAVMMPFRYTSTMSQEDAAKQAATMGVRYDVIPIAPIYDATIGQLESIFEGAKPDVTEENIQARCRGMLLMGISNKTGRMLLTTGNKSEMAVGYATLYGDMAGGFAPIKDCRKTLVYRLARYRNTLGEVIPERVITREPSAELRPGQKDSDSLPDYDVLDPILEAFIEQDLSVDEITARGYERETVIHVLQMVKHNEYKRRQAPPGIRISSRGCRWSNTMNTSAVRRLPAFVSAVARLAATGATR